MKSIAVFCGSRSGTPPLYAHAARAFGTLLARSGISVVYGGAQVGLMGEVADGALAAGGRVVGVIPHALAGKEVAHPSLTELHFVATMHERKQRMCDLSEGFVALPGGMGTLDELCEIATWAQLGIHARPCGLFNVGGFYDPFLAQLDRAAAEGFLKPVHRSMIIVESDATKLLEAFRAYVPPVVPKWISRSER